VPVAIDVSSYLVRVKLHQANYQDYENLHRAMAARGFGQAIRAGDGTTYALPTAEYVTSTSQNGDQVRVQAKAAANSTECASGVLVVEYSGAWWNGLAATRAA